MKIFKNFGLLLLVVILCFNCACTGGGDDDTPKVQTAPKITSSSDGDADNVKVSFDIQNYGTFTVETYPKHAPESVARFLELVKIGYYDGSEFESIYPARAMVASGSTVLSSGECKDTINGEFSKNGYSNELSLTRGTLAFCHLPGEYNTATSKFMIILGDNLGLDGEYAAFARVVEGNTVFDNVASAPIDADGKPVLPIVMKKVYIDE